MPRSLPGLASLAALGLSLAAMLVTSPRAEAAPSAEDFDAMCRDVAAVAGGQPNVTTGVVIVDLETGDRCAINADRTYRSASLYKTLVAAELWRQVEEGIVDLDQPLVVEPRHHIDDAPTLRPEDPYTVSVSDAAERMITHSDNGTAFALRELLGVGTVSAATEWLDMPATSLGETFVTSPNDQAELFTALARGEVVDEASSQAIVDLLLRQVIGDMIPAGLPDDADVRVAHKTGTLEGFLHDAGIVFAPGGDFVLVVMTENGSYEGALNTIRDVAASAYLAYAVPTEPVPTPTAVAAPVATPVATIATTTTSDTLVAPSPTVIFSDDPATTFADTLQEPMVLGGVLVLVAAVVMAPVLVLRRRPSPPTPRGSPAAEPARGELALDRTALLGMGTPPALHYRDNDDARALTPEGARLRADRSERGLVMRFGSRRDDDGRPAPMSPTSRSVAEVSEQPICPPSASSGSPNTSAPRAIYSPPCATSSRMRWSRCTSSS